MRSKLTRAQWKELVEKKKEDGQTDQDYAKANGINVAQLRYWRRNLKALDQNSSEDLVEVSGVTSGSGFPVRITLTNGIQIEVLQLSNPQAILNLSEGLNKL